jgi:transcriptional regulator with XRE-family HTH domain
MVMEALARKTRTPGPYIKLGRRIAELRRLKGLSQREFARLVGMSEGYPSQFEGGHNRPDSPMLRRIADVLEADLDELAVLAAHIDPRPDPDELDRAIDDTWAEYDDLTRRTQETAKRLRELMRRRRQNRPGPTPDPL